MPLNKLDNFIKNTEGRILYVSPSDLDSTDSITNQGNSLARPFKTLQRALIESARFSYVKGRSNDIVEKTTILLMPGEHYVDNRPGYRIYNLSGTATVQPGGGGTETNATSTLNLDLNTNFDLTQEDNILYKFNSVHGGVVVPRGTSIVGLDLRKTKIRPKYVPNPLDNSVNPSSIFKITGSCYFWQFSVFDGNDSQLVYIDGSDFSAGKKASPTFSHHKLTVFEYCDGVNDVTLGSDNYDITDLDMYYAKLSNAYNQSSGREIQNSEKYPVNPLAFEPQRPEYEIVGAFAPDPLTLQPSATQFPTTGIQAGNDSGVTTIVTVRTSKPHNFQVGTPIKIRGVVPSNYNISAIVTFVSDSDDTIFTYTLPNPPSNLDPGNISAATVTVETDTVSGASPYIFNISMRSVYGMNGLKADGNNATGFKSMVVAQFTGVSLQKDDRAFVKYDKKSRTYNGITISSAVTPAELSSGSSSTATGQGYHLDSEAVYRQGWETTHINILNDGILQIVSVFAIGYAKHFSASSGSDASITNSNSNFGQLSLISDGFKKEAFDKDNKAWITSIIPPRNIESTEDVIDWISIDVSVTTSVGVNTKLYLSEYKILDIVPPVLTQGYRVGAKVSDKLYVKIGGNEKEAGILTPNGSSSFTEYSVVTPPTASSNSIGFTSLSLGATDLLTGEKVIVISETGDLPENIDVDKVYYVINNGNSTSIKLASSEANALLGSEISISGGVGLKVLSRVSDKIAGDIGHPIQYDTTNTQWYINTEYVSGGIYDSLASVTEVETDPTYIKRTEDSRSLDERIYKLRVVIPQELGTAKNPENGFIIQPSSSTGARSDADFTLSNTLSKLDYDFDKNPGFIANCTSPSPTGIASITTELPHGLNVGDDVNIINVTDSVNVAGAANTGYNGSFSVTTVHNNMQFAYQPSKTHGTSSTNNTATRTTSLPRFERNNIQSNLYVYRNEVISDYIKDEQDGVYHIYALAADNKIPEEFDNYKYSQNVVDLYPQLDRDNVDSNPRPTKSFAKRAPLGEVVSNELKKSVTKESTDKFIDSFGIGVTLTSVSDGGTNATLTFGARHGYAGINTGSVTVPGDLYSDGTYYNIKLLNGSTSGVWQGATAKVNISGSAIASAEIMSHGSGYNATSLYFDPTVISGNGSGRFNIVSSGISSAIGNVIQLTGVGTTDDGYYRITGITDDNIISIAKTAGDPLPVVNQYAYGTGPSVAVASASYSLISADSTSGITTFTTDSGHGLVAGNSFRLLDASNNNLGDYVVNSRIGVTTFTALTGTGGAIGTPEYILKHGLASNSKASDRSNENLAARTTSIFDNEYTNLSAELTPGSSSIQINTPSGIGTGMFPYGSYLQVDNEIMRVASPTLTGANQITVIRGALATGINTHNSGSLVKAIKPIPVEFRRPSILRASGHTFEYLGYGPGNYSTALPQVQDRTLTEREDFLVQSQEKSGGIVVYTGMNSKGDFYIGNQKKSSATGEETTFDTPIPTITGEDPARLSAVFDEVTVKERIVVEGGDSRQILSQFDGPVTFNNSIRFNSGFSLNGQLKVLDNQQATSTSSAAVVVSGGVGIGKSMHVGGDIKTSGYYQGDGRYLTNLPAQATISNNADNRVITGGTGVNLNGEANLTFDGTNLDLGDDKLIRLGNSQDLTIQHDGDNSIIKETGTGGLYLQSEGNVFISKESGNANDLVADFNATGGVSLYHNTASAASASKKFETTAAGITIQGEGRFVGGDVIAFASSDKRLKDNISPIKQALDKVKSLSGNTFDWNSASGKEGSDTGVIAQEVDALNLPGITTIRDDGTYAVRYERLVPVLIEAIKELSAKVDNLEQKLSDK